MTRQAFGGTILLVEGGTDRRFFGKFTDPDKCQLLPTHEKDRAIRAVVQLSAESFPGVLAIVDADFWHVDGRCPPSPNILVTDVHDVELMIVRSDAFDRFIDEFGSASKIKRFLENNGSDGLRSSLLRRCLPLGLLRWLSSTEGFDLVFDGLRFKNFVDRQTLCVDIEGLLNNVRGLTTQADVDWPTVDSNLDDLLSRDDWDVWNMCCGHDFVGVLCIGLKNALSTHSGQIASPKNIERSLRLAYDARDFRETELYVASTEWEENNSPFEVFSV